MARSDILSDGVYVPTEVGSQIYVWSRPGSGKPNGDRGCVISSHGMDIDNAEIIKTAHPKPQVDLYFYSPHGYSLPDNSVEGVMTRKTKWYEKVGAGSAELDYTLTKAQGSHSAVMGHENYGHLQKGFHPEGRRERAKDDYMDAMETAFTGYYSKNTEARIGRVREAQASYKSELARISDVVLDVVTIRNRRGLFYGHCSLFSVLALLRKKGYLYSEVHCNFCRGGKEGHRMELNKGV